MTQLEQLALTVNSFSEYEEEQSQEYYYNNISEPESPLSEEELLEDVLEFFRLW